MGLGEALFYLVNPIGFNYMGKEVEGEVFDKECLALPKLLSGSRDVIVGLVSRVKL